MSAVIELGRSPYASGRPSLDRLTALTAADVEGVNRTIVEGMRSPVLLIPRLAGHIVAAGGKRLRPMITLASARLCGYEGTRHIGLAACVEFIHTATLLHDDVVDESDLRRGRTTANAIWGNKASVLVGDFLFSRSFELMVADGSQEVLLILSEASSVIAEGEVLQSMTTNDIETTEEDCLEVISSKTAKLFAAAAEVGAVVAERGEEDRARLRAFGHAFGMAFQLIDDMLDYSARQATLGKTVGDDFREGKVTLPVILALREAEEPAREFWRRTIEDVEQKKGDLKRAIAMLERSGALAATFERARGYAAEAARALEGFPDCDPRAALREAVDFVIARDH